MKRNRSPNDRICPKRPRTDGRDGQHYSFQFQDGRLVDFWDYAGASGASLVCDLDALHRLVQQDFPIGHVTITLDHAAILNAGLAPAVAVESHSPAPSSPGSLPLTAESGVAGLLICQPVAMALLAALPFKEWMNLRGVAHCWRDAVDLRLRSLKELNACDLLRHKGEKIKVKDEKKAKSLLKFMSGKAPGVQSLVVCNWISACPKVLKIFVKLKRVDMEGATLNPELLDVLEELPILESLEAVSLPSEPQNWDSHHFRESFKTRLQILIGRLSSLQSLTCSSFSEHPALLQDLTNPEKLTSLRLRSTYCPLPSLQSLSRFINLKNLEVIFHGFDESGAVLASALKQLKALECVDIGKSVLSNSLVKSLAQLPLLKRLTVAPLFYYLPDVVHWSQFIQLSCLELGAVRQTFIPYINQIATLNSLKLCAWGRVKFSCSLPQLHTLCLDRGKKGSFQLFLLDFQPACCNVKNLSLFTPHRQLRNLAPGLLNQNMGLKTLQIGWAMTGGQALLAKAKVVAQACQNVETLEFSHSSKVKSVEDLLGAAAMFVAGCPSLKNLRVSRDYVAALKAKEEFAHLNIAVCSSSKDSWMFE